METLTIIPFIFLGLIFILFIWAIIFMKGLKRDKKRLTTLFSDDKGKLDHEMLYLEMARSYERKGNIDKAIEYYFLFLRKFPGNAEVFYKVGNLLSKKSPQEASEYWEKAASLGFEPAIQKLKDYKKKKEDNEESSAESDRKSGQ